MTQINLYKFLFEREDKKDVDVPENPVTAKSTEVKFRPVEQSVDDQIDALILKYEKSSLRKKSEIGSISESLRNLNLNILIEAEEDEGLGDIGGEEDLGDMGGDEEPSGSEEMTVKKPAEKQKIPPLDIDEFANKTIRLIMNFETLISPAQVIINRVKHFLDENYGDQFVKRYLEILKGKGIDTSENNVKYAEDDVFAVGAYAGGTGGLGGGGA